jgi:hypothetical protein
MFRTKTNSRWMFALCAMLLAACSPIRASRVAPTPQVEVVPANQLAPVDFLAVEFGVGSPIPVQVVIDASFPDPCAQLVTVQQSRAGSAFDIAVMTSPADEACASPMGSLPFRFALPLNAAGLEPGTYTVTVNGKTTTFNYPPAAAQ